MRSEFHFEFAELNFKNKQVLPVIIEKTEKNFKNPKIGKEVSTNTEIVI